MTFDEHLENLLVWHVPMQSKTHKTRLKKKIMDMVNAEIIGSEAGDQAIREYQSKQRERLYGTEESVNVSPCCMHKCCCNKENT